MNIPAEKVTDNLAVTSSPQKNNGDLLSEKLQKDVVSSDKTSAQDLPQIQQAEQKQQIERQQSKEGQQAQNQQQQQRPKRKHRRGKPKCKNGNKPYKKTNWKFHGPRLNNGAHCGNAGSGGGGGGRGYGVGGRPNHKILRTRPLVPYNTNKFLMEEHLAEIPSAVVNGNGRTRDSSFSLDSEDNYFFSLPEDEEEFLTKEFANVYEKARVERLENLTKQELIEECLQIEDRYSKDQCNLQQRQYYLQRTMQEYIAKLRLLEEKVLELSRENYNLRCQLMRSATLAAAAAASPPSASTPPAAAYQPTPMDSSSEDSESDSSSSSSSSSTTTTSASNNASGGSILRRRCSSSPHSSPHVYHACIEDNNINTNGIEMIDNMNRELDERMEDDNYEDCEEDNEKSPIPSPCFSATATTPSPQCIPIPEQQQPFIDNELKRNVDLDGGGNVDN